MKRSNIRILKNTLLTTCLSLAALSCNACLEDITPQRHPQERGTFGEELYRIVHQNTENSAVYGDPIHLATFDRYRDAFVSAADGSAVEEDLGALNQVFRDIVPLYENLLYPGTLRKVAAVIDETRQDPEAVEALAYLEDSPSILKNPEQANPIARVFSFEDVNTVTQQLLSMLLKHSSGEYNATNQLLKALSIEMTDLEVDGGADRFLFRVISLLTKTDELYGPAMSIAPQEAVRLGEDGKAELQPVDGKAVYAPFVDEDNDGRPDGNSYGYYVANGGARISPYATPDGASPYLNTDEDGHLFRLDQPVFRYFDLQQTPLAYLVREGDELLISNALDELLRAAHTLLGEGLPYSDEHGSYLGFSKTSGVAQLIAALFTTLDHDSVGLNFEAVISLLRNYPEDVARLVDDLDRIIDIADEAPTNFAGGMDLVDRLVPMVRELLEDPGFLPDLLEALADPMTAKLGAVMADLIGRRSEMIRYDADSAWSACASTCHEQYTVGTRDHFSCITSCHPDAILGTLQVDRTQPETELNRSLFQRISNLMWETSAQPYDVYVEKLVVNDVDVSPAAAALGNIITFDNLAEAYLQTITGDLQLAEHMSPTFLKLAELMDVEAETIASLITWITDNLLHVKLSLAPTTAEVTRLFNMTEIRSQNELYTFNLNVARCRDGRYCYAAHADTLFALEASGMVDALYPVVRVFNNHHKTAVLARIVSTLFEYYPSGTYVHTMADGSDMPLQYGNFRSAEPLLQRALNETSIIDDLGNAGDIMTNRIELSDGSRLTDRFTDFVNYLLTPDTSLRNLKGNNFTTDPRGNRIEPLSPAYLYIDAIRDISAVFDAHPELDDQFGNGLEGLMDVTIRTQKSPDGKITFVKPAGIRLIADIVELLRELYLEKATTDARHEWITNDIVPNAVDLLSSRIPYSYFVLFDELDRDNGLENFRRLVLWLMESGSEDPRILPGTAYILFSWILEQRHLIALSHRMAGPIDPDRVWTTEGFSDLSFVVTLLTCVDAFNQCDPTGAFNRVFYRLFETETHPVSNMGRLFEVAQAMFRPDPGIHYWCEAACHKGILDFAYDLFTDTDRGVERIYEILDFTIWGIDRRPKDWKPEDASWQIQH